MWLKIGWRDRPPRQQRAASTGAPRWRRRRRREWHARLYRWLKSDPVFIAAYNTWQRDVLATARGKMLALADLAVAKAMSRGDGKLALRVLERMGVAEKPIEGETDVREVKRKQEQAARVAELERRQEAVELARKTKDVDMAEMAGGGNCKAYIVRRQEKIVGGASREAERLLPPSG